MRTLSVKKQFITFGKPDISEEEISAVSDVMRSGWIGTGKVAREFEEEFVRFMGGGYAVSVSSCSIGLAIALRSVGVCRGSKVLTTPLTFCATVNAIINVGGTPVFKDVHEDGGLDYFDSISDEKFHAIVPVNMEGLCATRFSSPKVPIVEDCAHSFGGQVGLGDIKVFSLYATKNITSGEGGIIWTHDKYLADKCRILSNNGQSSGAWGRYSSGPINNYHVLHPGFKGNFPDVLAAIGLVQLRRWPEMKKKRAEVWKVYEKAFGKKPYAHSKHLYTIRVKERHQMREDLYNKGIGTGIHYEALHLEPAYQFLGYKKGDFPVAEKIGEETLSLPVSNTMTKEDADYVVKCVKEIL